jgi:nucleotide-binding universal stress UspA family protein
MGKVVVGVDGSPGSIAALRFAVEEARLRGADLAAVSAWTLSLAGDVPGGFVPSLREDFAKEAAEVLDDGLGQLDTTGITIERVVEEGTAARTLVEAAKGADMLVVGSRGRGGFAGLLLGSVSQQCAHHATCPVAIVRSPDEG